MAWPNPKNSAMAPRKASAGAAALPKKRAKTSTNPDIKAVMLQLSAVSGQEACMRALMAGTATRKALLAAQSALQTKQAINQ